MRRYTIAGTTYIAEGDRLYVARDEAHDIDQLDEDETYLHEESVVTIRYEFSTVTVIPIHADDSEAASRTIHESNMEPLTPVDSVIPDGIVECPECGGWLGPEDEPSSQFCIECGHGTPGEA